MDNGACDEKYSGQKPLRPIRRNRRSASSFLLSLRDRILVLKLLNSQRREQIEKLFVQSVRTYLQELIRNKPHNISLDYADIEVALDFWAFGIAGLLF